MTAPVLLSILELGGYPDFSPLYQSLGYETRIMNSMRKAIKFIKNHEIDVIVAEFNFQSDFRDRSSQLESSLTRQQYMLHSGLQENVRSRRSLQSRVTPLTKATTLSWRFLEAPNLLYINKLGHSQPAHGQRYQSLLENDYSGALMPCREQAGCG